jgi:ubiquinone/menaquinone biosynthesis C-methylase UbiE
LDYDQGTISASYDAARGYSSETLALWMGRIEACAPERTETILDLGCGTGRYSFALADRFGARVVGVDRSVRMLAEARRKGAGVHFARVDGEALPVRDGAIDLALLSMVLHHFDRPERPARECARVLRPGGVACVRAGTTDAIGGYAYVSFFEAALPVLERTLQSRARIESIFRDAGLALERHELVASATAESWTDYVRRIELRADSILAQLSDRDFEDGMRRLAAHATTAPEGPVVEEVDLFAFRRR